MRYPQLAFPPLLTRKEPSPRALPSHSPLFLRVPLSASCDSGLPLLVVCPFERCTFFFRFFRTFPSGTLQNSTKSLQTSFSRFRNFEGLLDLPHSLVVLMIPFRQRLSTFLWILFIEHLQSHAGKLPFYHLGQLDPSWIRSRFKCFSPLSFLLPSLKSSSHLRNHSRLRTPPFPCSFFSLLLL